MSQTGPHFEDLQIRTGLGPWVLRILGDERDGSAAYPPFGAYMDKVIFLRFSITRNSAHLRHSADYMRPNCVIKSNLLY